MGEVVDSLFWEGEENKKLGVAPNPGTIRRLKGEKEALWPCNRAYERPTCEPKRKREMKNGTSNLYRQRWDFIYCSLSAIKQPTDVRLQVSSLIIASLRIHQPHPPFFPFSLLFFRHCH